MYQATASIIAVSSANFAGPIFPFRVSKSSANELPKLDGIWIDGKRRRFQVIVIYSKATEFSRRGERVTMNFGAVPVVK